MDVEGAAGEGSESNEGCVIGNGREGGLFM